MPGLTIRWRLTLWYGGLLAGSLLLFGTVVYTMFARNLMDEIDRALEEEVAELMQEVRRAAGYEDLLHQLDRSFANHPFYEIQVSQGGGEIVFATDVARRQPLPVPDIGLPIVRSTVDLPAPIEAAYRVSSCKASGPAGDFVVQAAKSLDLYHRELGKLLAVLFGATPLVVVGALVIGWFLSTRALAPVDRMIAAARDIGAQQLCRRLPVANPHDELGRLAATFNDMIARLERSFDEIRRFTADAAHELRTPLAVLRCEADVALETAASAREYRHVLENQLEEIDRLARLADELLLLCREDARLSPLRRDEVAIDRLLAELVDTLSAAAEVRGVELALDAPVACVLAGDRDRLRRLFFNLIENAIKYTPAGGDVRVSCRQSGSRVEVAVCDTGVGIAAEHLPHLFQRFYRVDASRASSGGFGLGLSIARSLVEIHQGTIGIESRPGAGTTVSVALPVGPLAVAPSAGLGPSENRARNRLESLASLGSDSISPKHIGSA